MIPDKTTKEFLSAIDTADELLAKMSFEKDYVLEKGPAYFVYYKKQSDKVEFLFGPPEFHVEMIIYISNKEFSFRDLLQIPAILDWVNNNRFTEENNKRITSELLWYIELLKISLPILK